MNALSKIFIVIACLVAFVYFGQAQKAYRVEEIRKRSDYEKGKITEQQYENFKKQRSFVKTLLNPRQVLSVD